MQTRSKRAKKDNKDENPVETEASVVICGGRPSSTPAPGSNAISGMPKMPPITDIDPTSGVPYATLVDQVLKTDSPSNPTSGVPDPTTPTERSDILIPPFKMLMSLPGQGQSVMAVPHAQTITSNMKHGEHFITVPMSVVATLQKETTTEERVTIPVHLLQQEIQKQAQQTQQPDVQQARMIATHPESECLSPVPLQLNKSITSITGTLMFLPSTKPSSPSVLTGIPSPIHQSQPGSTTSMGPGLAQEPQAISEMTIANKSTLAIPSTSTHLENSRGFEKHTKTHNAELELEEHMRTHNAELEEHLGTYNAEIQEQMRTYNIELEPIRAHNEALKKHIRTFDKELRRHTKTYKSRVRESYGNT
ncbi:unnamed protein product [Mytilus coruscus]|uniref:Uncharacterized protein n=1 Tax=Mytilus coruscus TaxID=42192 RepID=A0A6J8A910_MYTCO|nr:unnamed protein product [Mytilus coruscus]